MSDINPWLYTAADLMGIEQLRFLFKGEPDRIRKAVMEALWWARDVSDEEIYAKYVEMLNGGDW